MMHKIEIDDDVLGVLKNHAHGFRKTENDVLRDLLNLNVEANGNKAPTDEGEPKIKANAEDARLLMDFFNSTEFKPLQNDDDKYLSIISWLCRHHSSAPTVLLKYPSRKRRYFAGTHDEIVRSGQGRLVAKKIPETDSYTLVTIDNKKKAGNSLLSPQSF